ncbi:histidine phosphatase family protein [Cereibacter changlensis JA139]|uniref:Histidine phosphatase family protein n=2 Tax=Cereibacter changlensis TaxID=402884 RepID=A0A2T4JQF2_9RHOB|nr:histidine phosphatase family protein [Cereibacter changlensis]PTE20142.1 histidine phosphatase family protein [Cereibacter changlensis JA139]PZX56250.1 putative phosphoglycerate mutase [Cereibacter changlensis]
MADLWFIRHFRTPWNANGRLQGRRDIALDDPLGPSDLAALAANAEALAGQSFSAVWCSPLRRARQTAALHGFEAPEILADLTEIDFGDFEGRLWRELEAAHPGLWHEAPHLLSLGESFEAFTARVARVLDQATRLSGPPVLVFGHGAWAGCLASLAEGRDPAGMNRLALKNGALLRLSPGLARVTQH